MTVMRTLGPDVRRIAERVESDSREATRALMEDQEATVLFEDLNGGKAVGNRFSTREKIAAALGVPRDGIVGHLSYAISAPAPCEVVDDPEFRSCRKEVRLMSLPVPKYFPEDGGRYITAGVIITELEGRKNVSFHRMMLMDDRRIAVRLVPRHLFTLYKEAKAAGKELSVSICIGACAEVLLAAATSMDFGADELEVASAMYRKGHGTPLKVGRCDNGILVPADCDYVMEARITLDEAKEGHGDLITVTRFLDKSIQVEDQGRGCPVDWNEKEGRYNWELVFCELYAGGKYEEGGDNYEFSLGLNGLGSCATQYASEYMDVTVWRDEKKYSLHFKKGKVVGKKGQELQILPADRKKTGTTIRWRPDLEVFTDIAIPEEDFRDVLHRQAVVNAGITFRLRLQHGKSFETVDYCYENGIMDYVTELAGEGPLTAPHFIATERRGRDREDKPEYKVKLSCACCFSNRVQRIEHYHNSSWLEHGGSPEKATKSAFVSAIDAYLKQNNKYQKTEAKITWQDIEDCLVLVSNNFSTLTSYENQTKKAITNKFVQEAMTEFLKSRLEVYFIENRTDAEKIAAQVLINKRSRPADKVKAEFVKKPLHGRLHSRNHLLFVLHEALPVKHRL